MSRLKRGLGKGISDLGLSELLESVSQEKIEVEPSANGTELKQLPVEKLKRGRYQPRLQMDETALQELADSIRAQGVIQPIVARKLEDGEFEIIAGERRWRAAQRAGLDSVPVVVRDIPDEAAIAMALIENIQRKDLNAIEEAIALQRLIDEFKMTHEAVAKAVGKSRTAVSNLLRLLQLAPEVRSMVEQGELDMGHARALLSVPLKMQPILAMQIVHRALSVRQTEQFIKQYLEKQSLSDDIAAHQDMDPDVKRLQNRLAETLGATVKISHNDKGRGKLVIQYNSLDELDGIIEHIK